MGKCSCPCVPSPRPRARPTNGADSMKYRNLVRFSRSTRQWPRPVEAAMRSVVEAMECRRMLSAGDPDPTYGGGDGTAEAAFAEAGFERVFVSSVDTRGGFTVVAGNGGTPFHMALARFNSSGQLDAGFHGDGRLTRPGFVALDVFIQPDGKILVGGRSGGRGA